MCHSYTNENVENSSDVNKTKFLRPRPRQQDQDNKTTAYKTQTKTKTKTKITGSKQRHLADLTFK